MATLVSAILDENLKQLEEILNSEPSPSQEDLNKALSWAASDDGFIKAVPLLFAHGAQITEIASSSTASSENTTMFEIFIKNGWDINSTEFHAPVLQHNVSDEKRTRWLLEHGADPNVKGERNSSALSSASTHSSTAVLDLLISYGANIETQALISAMGPRSDGGLPIMRYLIDHGVNINGVDPSKGTPLHYAVRLGRMDKVKLLVEQGADLSIKFYEQTPTEFALEEEELEIHHFLCSLAEF